VRIIVNVIQGALIVIARNKRIALEEMKKNFPEFVLTNTLTYASNSSGELGEYMFIKREIKK